MDFVESVFTGHCVPRIQFYADPPTHTIELEHLEQFAIERLKILKCVETVGQDFIRGSKEYNERLTNDLCKLGSLGKSFTLTSRQPKNIAEDIHKDITSHFILQVCSVIHVLSLLSVLIQIKRITRSIFLLFVKEVVAVFSF